MNASLPCRFAVLSDMIQRCPYTPVTALLLHSLKDEILASWPQQACIHEHPAFSSKGPFVTFGVSLVMDAVIVLFLICLIVLFLICLLRFGNPFEHAINFRLSCCLVLSCLVVFMAGCLVVFTTCLFFMSCLLLISCLHVALQLGSPNKGLVIHKIDVSMAALNVVRFLLIKDRQANVSTIRSPF